MIRAFSDHAANERTFLAWIRTGLAVIAFGFVIEKFNLFLVTIAAVGGETAGRRAWLERLAGPLGRYDGLALMIVGILLIIIGGIRYMRTAERIDAPELTTAGAARIEVVLAAGLALLASAFCVYLVVI
jgi:putative membrane protein